MTEITIAANDRRIQYTASGGQTVFPYDFPIFDDGEIAVYRTRSGATTLLTFSTDYTVSGAGAEAGGDVTLTSGATASDIITIVGAMPNARTTDFQEGGDFLAATINRELDRLQIQVQELRNRLDRTVRLELFDDPQSFNALPVKSARASKYAAFDANGQLVPTAGTSSLAVISTFAEQLLDDASAAAMLTTLGVSAFAQTLVDDADAAAARGTLGVSYGAGVRERLTAARTYYVRTDGSDSNNGLANTSGGAFLTIQKALDVIADTLDNAGYDVTIQSGDGTYTGTVRPRRWVGRGTVTLQGNAGTPANVVISTTSADAVAVDGVGMDFIVKDLELRTTTSGYGLLVSGPSRLSFSNIRFGACASAHVLTDRAGYIRATGNYAIVGSAPYHWLSTNGPGLIYAVGLTITLTGTPAFSVAFATAANNSAIVCNANTFSGAATGTRYSAAANGVINTNGGGASYLPGNAVGSTGTGGQYV